MLMVGFLSSYTYTNPDHHIFLFVNSDTRTSLVVRILIRRKNLNTLVDWMMNLMTIVPIRLHMLSLYCFSLILNIALSMCSIRDGTRSPLRYLYLCSTYFSFFPSLFL